MSLFPYYAEYMKTKLKTAITRKQQLVLQSAGVLHHDNTMPMKLPLQQSLALSHLVVKQLESMFYCHYSTDGTILVDCKLAIYIFFIIKPLS